MIRTGHSRPGASRDNQPPGSPAGSPPAARPDSAGLGDVTHGIDGKATPAGPAIVAEPLEVIELCADPAVIDCETQLR